MPQRITVKDLTGLDAKYFNFVIEYCKDFSARRAAEASGFQPDSGHGILQREDVQAVLVKILQDRLEASHIDAEWVLMEAVDNHRLARQQGNIPASNNALNLVAKHTFVDAYAAEKVDVTSDKDVMERLMRGRKRMKQADSSSGDENQGDEPSFF